jgi:hypothetical protein
VELPEGITVVRSLVDIATAGRFRPETFAPIGESPMSGRSFPQHSRIERADQ